MYVYDGPNNPAGLVTNFGSLAYLLNFDPYSGTTVAQNSGGSGYAQSPYTYGAGLRSHTTQLIQFGACWYDPVTGNWTQQDTLNTPLDPANGNRYTYAADNPTNNTDPTGTSCDSFWDCVSTPFIYAAGAGGVLAAAGGAIGCTIAGGPFDPPGGVAAGGTGAAIGGYIGWWGGLATV